MTNNIEINETDRSLKNGPVIKKKGIKLNKTKGSSKKNCFSLTELKIIKFIKKN